MNTLLDDIPQRTQYLYLDLAQSLENGERIPLESLIPHLQHPEQAIRKLTLELLEYNNDPAAIPALLEAATDEDIEVSIAAGEILRSFRHPGATAHLITGLTDLRPELRLAAVVALRDRRAPEAIAALINQLGDLEPEVRRETVLALASYRRDDLLIALRSGLRDGSASVRKAAVASVAEFSQSVFVFDDLIVALSDEDWQVRREAAQALSRFPGDAASRALYDTLSDPAWQVAREAALSLARLQSPGDDRIIHLLVHEIASLRIAAIIALGESGNPDWIHKLEPLLNDPDDSVKRSARRAIERLTAPRHQPIEL